MPFLKFKLFIRKETTEVTPVQQIQYVTICLNVSNISHKKVLLRERKRHTSRRVASPGGSTYLGRGGGGYLLWLGGTYLGWGVPTLARRVPTLAGGTYPGQGYLPWPGVPTLAGEYLPWLGWGTPSYYVCGW